MSSVWELEHQEGQDYWFISLALVHSGPWLLVPDPNFRNSSMSPSRGEFPQKWHMLGESLADRAICYHNLEMRSPGKNCVSRGE